MEHRISYKKERADKEQLKDELREYANMLVEIEDDLNSIMKQIISWRNTRVNNKVKRTCRKRNFGKVDITPYK